MAISKEAALQMVEQGRMKQSRYDSMVKRGKINVNPPFTPRTANGEKGFVMVKLINGMYIGTRLYPAHYKQKPKKISTTSRVEIEKWFVEQKEQVENNYFTVHFENGKVAVSDNEKRIVSK